jgi:hypothetical protein
MWWRRMTMVRRGVEVIAIRGHGDAEEIGGEFGLQTWRCRGYIAQTCLWGIGQAHMIVPDVRMLPACNPPYAIHHMQSTAPFNRDGLSISSLPSPRVAVAVFSAAPFHTAQCLSLVIRRQASSILLLHHQISLPSSSPTSLPTHLRRRPHRPNHPLQQLHPRLLPRLPQPNAHVLQQRRVPHVAGQRVALHVGRPLVLVCVCAADADEARL